MNQSDMKIEPGSEGQPQPPPMVFYLDQLQVEDMWTRIFSMSRSFDVDDSPEYYQALSENPNQTTTNLGKYLTLGQANNLFGFLGLDSKVTEPSLRVISNGVRDVPVDLGFRSSLDVWRKVDFGGNQGLQEAFQVLTNNQKSDKNGILEGSISTLFGETFVIEHLLECRFAGPILRIATTTGDLNHQGETNEQLWVTISILKMIFNHRNNLAWTSKSLNDAKTKFFNGTTQSIHANGVTSMQAYLKASGPRIQRLVQTIYDYAPKAKQSGSLLNKVLALIYYSPFGTGNWWKFTESTKVPVGSQIDTTLRLIRGA